MLPRFEGGVLGGPAPTVGMRALLEDVVGVERAAAEVVGVPLPQGGGVHSGDAVAAAPAQPQLGEVAVDQPGRRGRDAPGAHRAFRVHPARKVGRGGGAGGGARGGGVRDRRAGVHRRAERDVPRPPCADERGERHARARRYCRAGAHLRADHWAAPRPRARRHGCRAEDGPRQVPFHPQGGHAPHILGVQDLDQRAHAAQLHHVPHDVLQGDVMPRPRPWG
mmetsp:Transcript_63380/g.200450  ORF Transcript_63380/g.200450 Transcript_63380/m.200450 type:complete len:222 (-) Transcript_63380:84-749(-)